MGALNACGADHARAAALFTAHPLRTPRTFNALLGVLHRATEWRRLLALFDRMRAEGVPPDQRSFALAVLAADALADEARGDTLLDELAELKGMTRAEAEEAVRRNAVKKKRNKEKAAAAAAAAAAADERVLLGDERVTDWMF